MDESELVDGVDGEGGLGDVELRALLAQRVLLHQQRHHVACRIKHIFGETAPILNNS